MEGENQGMKKIAALLAHGGQTGAGDAEGVSAWRGAKATGDLLLQFRHPNVALGLVVVKQDTRIVEETQHIVGVSVQTSEEIDRSRLLDPSASAFDTHCFGVKPLACGKDRLIPCATVPQTFPSQRRLPLSRPDRSWPRTATRSVVARPVDFRTDTLKMPLGALWEQN